MATERARRSGQSPFLAAAAILFLLGAGACAPTSQVLALRAGPDSTGLAVLDCRFSFEFTDDTTERNLGSIDTEATVERFAIPQGAQSATIVSADVAERPIAARPNRGLLLLGPLKPGSYLLEQVGLDRDYIGGGMRSVDLVREPVTFRPGSAGTERLLFVVEPGGVIYIGRMNARGVLDSAEKLAGQGNVAPTPVGMLRIRMANDDRIWSVTWDRSIDHEIAAWELMLVSLRNTAWRDPIVRRLERLKGETP